MCWGCKLILLHIAFLLQAHAHKWLLNLCEAFVVTIQEHEITIVLPRKWWTSLKTVWTQIQICIKKYIYTYTSCVCACVWSMGTHIGIVLISGNFSSPSPLQSENYITIVLMLIVVISVTCCCCLCEFMCTSPHLTFHLHCSNKIYISYD